MCYPLLMDRLMFQYLYISVKCILNWFWVATVVTMMAKTSTTKTSKSLGGERNKPMIVWRKKLKCGTYNVKEDEDEDEGRIENVTLKENVLGLSKW